MAWVIRDQDVWYCGGQWSNESCDHANLCELISSHSFICCSFIILLFSFNKLIKHYYLVWLLGVQKKMNQLMTVCVCIHECVCVHVGSCMCIHVKASVFIFNLFSHMFPVYVCMCEVHVCACVCACECVLFMFINTL